MTIPDLGWWFRQGLNLGHPLSKSEPNELTGQQLQIINSSKGDKKLDNIKSSYQCRAVITGWKPRISPTIRNVTPSYIHRKLEEKQKQKKSLGI